MITSPATEPSRTVPIVHSGQSSEVVGKAVAALLSSTFPKLQPELLLHHDALLHDWSSVSFTIFSLNPLNIDDVWINAAAGAAYCAAPQNALTRICPVLFEITTEDSLFSRFQGVVLQDDLGAIGLLEELNQLVASVATRFGFDTPGHISQADASAFFTTMARGSRELAGQLPPLNVYDPMAGMPTATAERISTELDERITGPLDAPGQVFVSWSKNTSRLVGNVLRDHLQAAVTGTAHTIYYSPTDIGRGDLWLENFAEGLRRTTRAVFCINEENTSSRWMAFELGALITSPTRPVLTAYRLSPDPLRGFSSLFSRWAVGCGWLKVMGEHGGYTSDSRDPVAEFTELLTMLGLPDSVSDEDAFRTRLDDALTGEVLKDLSVAALKTHPDEVDLNDHASNAPWFDLDAVTLGQARKLASVDLRPPFGDTLVQRVVTWPSVAFHSFPESGDEMSQALAMLCYLSQRKDLSSESYRAIAEYTVSHVGPEPHYNEQMIWFLLQADGLDSETRTLLTALNTTRWMEQPDLSGDETLSGLVARVPDPLPEEWTAQALFEDLQDFDFSRIEVALRSQYLTRGYSLVSELMRDVCHPKAPAWVDEFRDALVERHATELPASWTTLLAFSRSGRPDLLDPLYLRCDDSFRGYFALWAQNSDDLERLCLSDSDASVLRNLLRNEHVGHLFVDRLADHSDPWVADAVPARRFQDGGWNVADAARMEHSMRRLAREGWRLVSPSGPVLSLGDLLPTETDRSAFAQFLMQTPVRNHLMDRLGLDEGAARSVAGSEEVFASLTPTHVLSWLQNRRPSGGETSGLGVPFPQFSGAADNSVMAEQCLQANFIRLIDLGYRLEPVDAL